MIDPLQLFAGQCIPMTFRGAAAAQKLASVRAPTDHPDIAVMPKFVKGLACRNVPDSNSAFVSSAGESGAVIAPGETGDFIVASREGEERFAVHGTANRHQALVSGCK